MLRNYIYVPWKVICRDCELYACLKEKLWLWQTRVSNGREVFPFLLQTLLSPWHLFNKYQFIAVHLPELPTAYNFNWYQYKTDEWLPYCKTTIFNFFFHSVYYILNYHKDRINITNPEIQSRCFVYQFFIFFSSFKEDDLSCLLETELFGFT